MNNLQSSIITKIKPVFIVGGILYLSYVLSTLIWLLFANEQASSIQTVQNKTHKENTALPTQIFGKEQKVVKKVYKEVKQSKLSLVLVGIINKKNNSVAIIKLAKGGIEKVYKVGAKINNTASVKDIGSNFVIINHNGNDEKLSLKYKTNATFKEGLESVKKKNTTNVAKNTQIKDAKLNTQNKRKLRGYLANMRTNPASALSVVQVEPNFVSGLLNGFKVFPAREKKLFNEIGFKPGDIIIKINDIELNRLSKAFKIGRELSTQKVFDFTVLRNEIEYYIHLNLN